MTLPLPDTVARIRAGARSFAVHAPERAATALAWVDRANGIRRAVPSANVEDGGETVRLGELSAGCIACKRGSWDCIFVTMRCDLACPFCLRPTGIALDAPRSALGGDVATLAERYATCGVTGASFSGGEPFLEAETVVDWTRGLREALPHLYLWAYTNGRALTPGLIGRLAAVGLDELRFDAAATGYADAHVDAMLAEAARTLTAVAVEVPAIPAQRLALLGSLERWAEHGVRYLNLHELVYEQGTASGRMAGRRARVVMPDGHRCETDPDSVTVTQAVLARVHEEGLPLAVNDCSLANKARQARGRRRRLATYSLRPYEVMDAEGVATSAVLFDETAVEFVPLAEWETRLTGRPGGWSAARVARLLPLDPEELGEWVGFELLAEGR